MGPGSTRRRCAARPTGPLHSLSTRSLGKRAPSAPFTTSPATFSASAPGCMLQAPKLRVRTRHGAQHLRCWPLCDIICLQLVALLRPARSFRARISVSGCASSQRTHTRKWIPMHTHTHALSALHANCQIGRGYSGRGIARG